MNGLARLGAGAALAATLAACGAPPEYTAIEQRVIDQAAALDIIGEALRERSVAADRAVPVRLPDGTEWTVDLAGRDLAIAIEFLSAQDRDRVGALLPIPASPDETPRVVIVRRVGVEGDAGRLYLRVFTDEHYRYELNPPPDLPRAPYTLREAQARLQRDVKDYVAWFLSARGPGETP